MGDRTYVSLYVPIELAEEARNIIDKSEEGPAADEGEARELAFFGFEQVNYGELHFLPDLKEAGIAYDGEWQAGSDYGSGVESLRFTSEGEAKVITVYDQDKGIAIQALLDIQDNHEALKQLIQKEAEGKIPLPWDNQVQYGKVYRLRQLIEPKE